VSPKTASRRPFLPSSPFNKSRAAEEAERLAVEQFAVEELVHHDTFGLGRVVQVEAGIVTVVFGSQQIRIDSPFRKLSKL
jgi:hypothetical protein